MAAVLIYYLPLKDVAYLDTHSLYYDIKGNRPVLNESEAEFLCEFENHVLSLNERYANPGLAVAIVKGDKLIYRKGFGFRNMDEKLPVTTSTIFRIGSVSKGFAATLAGILEEEQVIEWDAPVSSYLPDYRVKPETYLDSVTVGHILSHTAGYPYQAYSTLIEDGVTLTEMIQSLQQLTLSRSPGTIHSYQNVAYSIIEQILQQQTSCSFQALMEERIFEPLEMNHASIDYESIINASNVALPHFYTSKFGLYVGEISPTYYNASAAGGINASIEDMGKWLMAVMGNKANIISDKVREELYKPKIVTAVKNSFLSLLDQPRSGHYGLGWRIIEYPSDTLVYHEGYVNGYKSAIGFSQTDNIGICILSNSGGRLTSRLLADFFRMHGEFYEIE